MGTKHLHQSSTSGGSGPLGKYLSLLCSTVAYRIHGHCQCAIVAVWKGCRESPVGVGAVNTLKVSDCDVGRAAEAEHVLCQLWH